MNIESCTSRVLYGPVASGKTRHADAIALAYGLRHVMDLGTHFTFDPKQALPTGWLYIVGPVLPDDLGPCQALSIGEALWRIGRAEAQLGRSTR